MNRLVIANEAASLIKAENPEHLERLLKEACDRIGTNALREVLSHGNYAVLTMYCKVAKLRYFDVLQREGWLDHEGLYRCMRFVIGQDAEVFLALTKLRQPGFDNSKLRNLLLCVRDYVGLEWALSVNQILGLFDLANLADGDLATLGDTLWASQKSSGVTGHLLLRYGFPADALASLVLREAAWNGTIDDCRCFLDAGAKLEDYGYEAIAMALERRKFDVAQYLIEQSGLPLELLKTLVIRATPDEWNDFDAHQASLKDATLV